MLFLKSNINSTLNDQESGLKTWDSAGSRRMYYGEKLSLKALWNTKTIFIFLWFSCHNNFTNWDKSVTGYSYAMTTLL
ncbi:MAG: hypothetical protein H8D23_25125 [Candidatus Brocadiales bacterium]|nr:hypothetical protein [Candidatus Brocadiales bacterium]